MHKPCQPGIVGDPIFLSLVRTKSIPWQVCQPSVLEDDSLEHGALFLRGKLGQISYAGNL